MNNISRFNVKVTFFDVIRFFFTSKKDYENFKFKIYRLINSRSLTFFSQGRVGLYKILNLLKKKYPSKKTVIITPYTLTEVINCLNYSDLKIIYVDIDIKTGLPEYKKLKNILNKKKNLALIITHLFTKNKDFQKILKLCRRKQIKIISDNAINFGLKKSDIFFGKESDFSFYSLNYQKNLSSILGGIVHCKNKKDFLKINKIKSDVEYPTFKVVKLILFINILNLFFKNKFFYNYFTFILVKNFFYKSKIFLKIMYPNYRNKIKTKITENYNWNYNYKLSYFGLKSINDFNRTNKHRIKISHIYQKIFNKYDFINDLMAGSHSVKLEYAVIIRNKLKNKLANFLLTKGYDIRTYWYSNNSNKKFKNSSYLEKNILCFPTHDLIDKKYLDQLDQNLNVFNSKIAKY